ncbi:phage tail protein I [Enterobacteriaceae bacterium BIT-l23]|nr:phage tail protein I [Enterobacteriaceae bacterium BIT-l23]
MMAKFRSLLPPSAITAERSMEQASTEQITAINTSMVRQVKSADDCPAHLLPWLAWELAVDFWEDTWTEEQKRQVIRDAAYVHQHRGTAGAVRRSLSAVSLPTTVIEWWQETPKREPYTFRVEVYSHDEINAELYDRIRRQVNKAKNLRSYLSSIDVIADIGATGSYFIGGAITAHIDIDIYPGE